MLRKIINKLRNIALNNIVTNQFLILIKKDYLIKKWKNNWADFKYNKELSPEENVGCSLSAKIQDLTEEMHVILREKIDLHFSDKDSVLDMGCGTGLFLRDFPDRFSMTGIDLNAEFLEVAKEIVPKVKTMHGNYLNLDVEEKFDVIISYGVLMYFEPSSLNRLVEKLSNNLNPGGKILFQYSHALLWKDTWFSDLSYVRYSPSRFEKALKSHFNVIEHHHYFDDRTVDGYDKDRYYYPNGKNDRVDTVQNTYLLVAEKK